jgi:protein-L-isoaspartate(D-aspartate) O-methyltransferase
MFTDRRTEMVLEQLIARGIRDESVLKAMGTVPRHMFVPKHLLHEAYEDHPVSIGSGQTISQPYIVALMLELAQPSKEKKLLEIGSGCGYLLAIASSLFKTVIGIERVEELYTASQLVLKRLKYSNSTVRCGDGFVGAKDAAPFDAIIISCSCEKVPSPLLDQLAPDGILVAPVGDSLFQELLTVHRTPQGFVYDSHGAVRFVPLVSDIAQNERLNIDSTEEEGC